LLLVPFWTQLHHYFGLYDSHRLEGWRSAAARTFTASTVGFLLTSVALVLIGLRHQLVDLAEFTFIWMVLVFGSRGFLYSVLHMMRKRGVDRRYVCVIGTWQSATEIAEQFRQKPEWGLEISTVGIGPSTDRKFFRFPDITVFRELPLSDDSLIGKDLEEILGAEVIDELLIISRPEDVSSERSAIDFCKKYGVQCRVRLLGDELESTPADYMLARATWTAHEVELNTMGLRVKRSLDVVLSLTMLVGLSPLFLLLAVLVKLSSPGPVFFKQTRVGLRGRKFVLMKFRTMVVGAESMLHLVAHRNITGGPIFKDAKDLRVTDIGRILRRFSLDELPQLFNVLKGDMSLVGPRPLPVHESRAIEGTYRRRFNMRPGITCHWQVQGRNEIGFVQWMELDVKYVDNWSLREDVKLLLLTIPAVFSGRGAY
jgi:exopolysaccharide biosynthesis polyprenyl glycosylphosphotransferase